MEPDEAYRILGVGADQPWEDVRAAYRRKVHANHPDVPGRGGEAGRRTARIIEAYAVARTARAAADLAGKATTPSRPPAPSAAPLSPPTGQPPVATGPQVKLEGDTLLVLAPAEEAFFALLDVADALGEVAYVDVQTGLLETIVEFTGYPTCSVLFTMQGSANGTEVYVTVESLGTDPPPPAEAVARLVGASLATPLP